MRAINDLSGMVFGDRTITGASTRRSSKGEVFWHFKCLCGHEGEALGANLRKSTGCERCRRVTHGQSRKGGTTSLYAVWRNMLARCGNPKSHNWKFYGGRGIAVAEEWLTDFMAFRDWSLANGYEPGKELDRRENDDGYSPGNCQWLTHNEHKIKHGKVSGNDK